jgi:hypothetical protein
MKARRTTLTKAEQALLRKLQCGTWAEAELDWLLAHLPPEDRQILVRFAKLLLEPRLTGGLNELLQLQAGLFERDVQRA